MITSKPTPLAFSATDRTNGVAFTLVVDDFGVKFAHPAADHLYLQTLWPPSAKLNMLPLL